MSWNILLQASLYSLLGCACMVVKDIVGTVLTDAIANGRHKLAGNMDGIGDVVSIVLASCSGVQLMHLGWIGWLFILPIGLVGKITTERATKWSDENIKGYDEK